MKIHRVVQMLGATTSTGKLASDMYDLGHKDYYSEAEGRYIPISHMDFQHMVRAFVKLCDQEEMLDRSKHMGTVKDQAKFYDDTIENNDKIYKKNLQEQEDKILELTTQVENLQERCNNKDNIMESLRDRLYDASSLQGCYYTFSEVPQDAEGNSFIKNCRKYLNRDSYKIRVKGQHLKPELYGKGRAYHGANMEDSTHMRVYIDTKKGE
jgi:hypothetical protein